MLIVDLVRHGPALPASPTGDRGRPLSPEGMAAVRSLAETLAGHAWAPDRIFSSPLVRAHQTAQILATVPSPPVPVEMLRELVPETMASEAFAALREQGVDSGHVVLVGHMPQIGQLFGLFTRREEHFPVGALRRVSFSAGLRTGQGEHGLALP